MATLDELLDQCHPDSPIEKRLVANLYPALPSVVSESLSAQYLIHLPPNTSPDFAFPNEKIAIYCDSYKYHKNQQRFHEDRLQSRELQLLGWIVLRFTGSEIKSQIEKVTGTILRALELKGVDISARQFNNLAEKFYSLGLRHLGRDAYDSGGNVSYDSAIENFTKAIELNSNFAAAFHERALAYYSKADYTRAIADYTQAITLNPDSPHSYWGRGAAYGKMENRKLAEEDYAMAELLEDERR